MNEFKEKLMNAGKAIKEKGQDALAWAKTHKKFAIPAALLLCLLLIGGSVLMVGSIGGGDEKSSVITADKDKEDTDAEAAMSVDVSDADVLDTTEDATLDGAMDSANVDTTEEGGADTGNAALGSTASTSSNKPPGSSSSSSSRSSGSKGTTSSSKPSGSNSGSANVSKPSSSGSTSNSKPSNSGSTSKPSSGNTSAPSTPVHTHSYTSSVTTQPTCCNPGVRTYTCSCGNSYTESIPATGNHNWVAQTWQKPVYDFHAICNGCGKDFGSGTAAAEAAAEHAIASSNPACGAWSNKYVPTGEYETITTGYKCSTCGATKGL